MSLISTNMANLTSLWQTGGHRAGLVRQEEQYTMSMVAGSQWPNKLWFHGSIDERALSGALDQVGTYQLTIPVWGPDAAHYAGLLKRSGLVEKTPLTGMSLDLRLFSASPDTRLRLGRVRTTLQAEQWASLFAEAFGYRIGVPTILFTQDVIEYYLGYAGNQAVGTAVLYQQETPVVGIHSMGIIPHQRRRGYARDFLQLLLAGARQRQADYATLQASPMGRDLYRQLGFTEDFLMHQFYYPIPRS